MVTAQDGLVPKKNQRFEKNARLLKTDEFSSVFRMRPMKRTQHFNLHILLKPEQISARFGIVVAKKQVPRAASRVLIKRLAREWFRLIQSQFPDVVQQKDIVLRVSNRFDKTLFISAQSRLLKRLIWAELNLLQPCLITEKQTTVLKGVKETPGNDLAI